MNYYAAGRRDVQRAFPEIQSLPGFPAAISSLFPIRLCFMDNWPTYLVRNRGALDRHEQQRLQKSVVAIVGCGGLGGFVIEELARIGVGDLLLVDPDRFEESNLNRQLYSDRQCLGRRKALVAAERVRQIHGHCRATALTTDFRDQADLLSNRAMVIVDGVDSLEARKDLGRLCRRGGKPLVHGAVNGWYGQVAVQQPGRDLIGRLYPDGVVHWVEPPSVLACTVATVASLQAAEVVKLLLGRDSALRDNWLSVDLLHTEFTLVPVGFGTPVTIF
ncbi:HesA/MoeB/ThiF family protein [Thermodesulfobacteriota bacterium B35]